MNKRIAIKEICDVYDGPHATPKKTANGPVYLGIDAITSNGKLNSNSFSYLSEKDFIKWTKRVTPQKDDIVFSYEATLGRYAIIPQDFYGCLGRRLAIVRNKSKNINVIWLYYYFQSPEWKAFIESKIVKGSTVNRISVEDFPSYTVPLIDIKNQDKIVSILSTIDDKIENNNLINDNLQQQLKLMYDYWFTQFDYPNKEGKPYRSSGGTMRWNEELKRDIPDGWIVKTLGEILCKNTESFDYKTIQPAIDLSVMSSDTIALSQLNSSENFNTNLFVMKQGDILFGSIRPYLHKAGFAPIDGVVAGTVHSYRVKNPTDYNFALFTLCRNEFFDYAVNVSSGTKMPVISSDSLLSYKLPYSEEIAAAFNQVAIVDTISQNIQETIRLNNLRNFLLPMLMNGQATIID